MGFFIEGFPKALVTRSCTSHPCSNSWSLQGKPFEEQKGGLQVSLGDQKGAIEVGLGGQKGA